MRREAVEGEKKMSRRKKKRYKRVISIKALFVIMIMSLQ
jgi:hypothetical protein